MTCAFGAALAPRRQGSFPTVSVSPSGLLASAQPPTLRHRFAVRVTRSDGPGLGGICLYRGSSYGGSEDSLEESRFPHRRGKVPDRHDILERVVPLTPDQIVRLLFSRSLT